MKLSFLICFSSVFLFLLSGKTNLAKTHATTKLRIFAPSPSLSCLDQGASKWLGFLPVTPLALVKKGHILPVGQPCCEAWAKKGNVYDTIDQHGDLVGEAVIEKGEKHGVIGCDELTMKQMDGQKGVGLYVSKNASAKPSSIPFFQPSRAEQTSLIQKSQELYSQVRRRFDVPSCQNQGEEPPNSPSAPMQTLFFYGKNQARQNEDRYAAVPGVGLTIFRLTFNHQWVLVYQESLSDIHPPCIPFSTPLAAVDMNQDGTPEIIFHTQGGPFWNDQVVSQQKTGEFRLVAKSVIGTSL